MKKIILLALAIIAANTCSNENSKQNPENQKQDKKYFLGKFNHTKKPGLQNYVKNYNQKNGSSNYYNKPSTLE